MSALDLARRMTNLCVVIPTRRRPANLRRLLENLESTLSPDSDVVIVMDSDDASDYSFLSPWWRSGVIVQADLPTSAKLNQAIMPRAWLHGAFMLLSDDTVPRERHWDRALMQTLRTDLRGTGWVYPDCGRGQNLPELCVISSDIVRALGWYSCPRMRHGTIDHVWRDLAEPLGLLRYRGDIHLDHLHPDHHTADLDEVYLRARSWGQEDARAYRRWFAGQGRKDDLVKIAAMLEAKHA